MTAPIPDRLPLSTELLREATQWRLLGLLFEPPDDAWRQDVQALGPRQPDEKLREASRLALSEADACIYHSTFGPGGPASPREVSYRSMVLPGALVSEIEAYYEAFGYAPQASEPPDHVAVEVGFVAYLRFKEAYAASHHAQEQVAVTSEAAGRFVAEHLAVLAGPLESALADSGTEYLILASQALRERTASR